MHSQEPLIAAQSDYYLYTPSVLASKIYLEPIVLGHFFYEPGYRLSRNRYDSFLLMYIRSGICTLHMDGKTLLAKKGQIILLDCYQPHAYSNQQSSLLEISWLHFDGPLARNYYDLITAAHGFVFTPKDPLLISSLLDQILHLFRTFSPINEASVSDSITHILTELLVVPPVTPHADNHSATIENVLSYINEHFREPLSLDALAARANLSPYYFTRVFTAETGFTPHQYLIATRLNSAKFLLRTPDLTLKEIAFSCGFTSESSFCSTFRKWEHMTPGEYRGQRTS